MWSFVVIGAVVVLVVLAVIALVMWLKVFKLERARKESLAKIEEDGNKKLAEYRIQQNKNIHVVATALLNEELSHTEAAMRLAYLLEQLGVGGDTHPEFAAIFDLRDKTAHIPVLAKWRALTAKEQRSFDKERLEIEIAVSDEFVAAVKSLSGREF